LLFSFQRTYRVKFAAYVFTLKKGGKEVLFCKSIKVKPLNNDNFKLYGQLVKKPERNPDAEVDTHNWWNNVANILAEDSISVGILQAKCRDFTVTKLEQHTRTAEMLVPLKGSSILVVGKKSLDKREIESMEAFYLGSNQVVILNVGILHFVPFPLEDEVIYAVVFRSKTPDDDLEFIEFEEDIKLVL